MILLIESGSTKTAWRYITQLNEAYESFYSAGINPYYQTRQAIQEAQAETLVKIEKFSLRFVYYFGTGITDEAKKQSIEEVLRPHIGSAKLHVENDLVAAGLALCGDTEGIACILGTGSNSGYFENGSMAEQVPPLGFWLGDEGSGGHLGKSLILAYLHKKLPSDLEGHFIKRFGELNRIEILQHAYRSEFPNRWFASFSKFLFDHRKHPYCYQLIEDAFQSFCDLYLKKYTKAHSTPIHFTGSVAFYYADILQRVLKANQLQTGIISEGPMAGLTLYYKEIHRDQF
ncbi:N-acetylglucosamine kinase [Aquirufa sp.]|jgi:N-acetylglucosamine kinase-like BadF-type ATPase|uniref:N-acetylglucosamine kinase n=1 Tax=Aquirufa sp. TaxID=2676249 RepID=UPI0037BFE14A